VTAVGDSAIGAGPGRGRESWWPRRPAAPVAVFAAAVLVGADVRWWQVSGRSPLSWNDTVDFVAGSRAPWTSLELWAGRRPPGAAVVLKLVGGNIDAYARAQAAFAAVCWAALAGSVATVVTGRARWPAVVAVVGFSLTTPATMWDRSVLSESLAVSALALVAAAVVQLARGVTWSRVGGVLAASAVWLATRDSHAVVVIGGGAALLAAATALWWRARRGRAAHAAEDGAVGDAAPTTPAGAPAGGGTGHAAAAMAGAPDGGDGDAAAAVPGAVTSGDGDEGAAGPAGDDLARVGSSGTAGAVGAARRLAALGGAAMVLGLLVVVGSAHGERHHFPIRNVYEVRVLPYPDRVEWFADRGMPQAEVFAGPDARTPHVEPGIPPVMFVGDDDGELGPWLDWVESEGRAAFARYVATHPLYLVSEPLRSPERAFNNALGDRGFYRPVDMPRVPLVDAVLALPTAVVLLVAALVGGWALGRGRWTPGLAAGAALAALAVPHGLVAWHSDGMETARHLVVPALQLHLGVLLVVVGVLSGEAASGAPATQTSGKPRSRLGRSSPPSASTTVPVT
jgi:hypothetical protein